MGLALWLSSQAATRFVCSLGSQGTFHRVGTSRCGGGWAQITLTMKKISDNDKTTAAASPAAAVSSIVSIFHQNYLFNRG